ncbi:DUF4244 domain-containing protein [Cellulomonas sp. JZ18]|uniref:DUF4244 domain-containing protein n=1 Tax=Cellulomonas sp. JZ18 TaxID=2654191 RepID=UPI001E5A5D8A|nr:DUF4244 domain-containing protein [Cellulomonas sp. JZ18]
MTGTECAGATGATGRTTPVAELDAPGAARAADGAVAGREGAGGDLVAPGAHGAGGERVTPGAESAGAAPGARLRALAGDAGMATAEYAIATLAAVGFAGLLVVILKGNEVKGLLTGIVRQALGG